MQRLLFLAALGGWLCCCGPLEADEPDQAEFVSGLRARYGPKLAEEYLSRLRDQRLLENHPRLRLESARTRLDLAAGASNLKERIRLSREALAEVDQLLGDARRPDVVAEARIVKLQIGTLHGKALLGQALRQESPEQRQADALRAREVLVEGGTQIQQFANQLDQELLKKDEPKNPAERQARKVLEDARTQAQLDLALNLIDQAQTYIDTGLRNIEQLRKRADLLNKAQTVLDRIAGQEPRGSLAWQARAWSGRCCQERDDPREARKRYEELARESSPAADTGKRLAMGFRLLRLLQVMQGRALADPGDKPEVEAQKLGEAWRKQYPGHLHTPEGYAVRFILAEAYRREAESNSTLSAPRKKELLEKARDLYREVELNDNEYAASARQRKIDLVLAMQGSNPEAIERIDPATLKSFDELYLRAQFEATRLAKDQEKYASDPVKLAEQKKTRYGRILLSLNRAIELATTQAGKVPEEDLHGAQLMLAYTLLISGDPGRAIVIAEELARKEAEWSQAPTLALYALQSYEALLAQPAGLDEKTLADHREKQRQWVAYVIQTWPDELCADVARHELAIERLQERRYAEAAELFASIRPGYQGLLLARYQLALTCFQLTDKDPPTDTDKDRRPWQVRGLSALEQLPALPARSGPELGRIYLLAKLKLGELQYKAGKFGDVEKLARELVDGIGNGSIAMTDEARATLAAGAYSLRLFASLARAEEASRQSKPEESLKIIEELAGLLQKEEAYREVLKKSDDLRRNLLDLALRLYFEGNRPADAAPLVNLAQKLEPNANGTGALETVLAGLIQQREALRSKGRKEELSKAEQKFEQFLDALAKERKDPGPGFAMVLAEGYASLDKHERASQLLRSVRPPDKEANAEVIRPFRVCRVMLVRELRLSNHLDEAEAILKEIQKEPWAAQQLEVRVEELHLMDARGQHAEAYPAWNRMVDRLASGIGQERNRDLYFECYFGLVESYYRHGQSQDEARKATITRKAAGFITDLERAWPDLGGPESAQRFRKLLEQEKPLKAEYEKRKGK